MQVLRRRTSFDFLGRRRPALALSVIVILACLVSLAVRGLNFGIDFTGGTLVEVSYDEPVDIAEVRSQLTEAGFDNALVQYFGTARDIMIRLPVDAGADADDSSQAAISSSVIEALRAPYDERLAGAAEAGTQQCVTAGTSGTVPCQVQMRRVEFVGPQVGDELTEQGGLAMLYALIGILIYVAWRFEWRFSVGAVAALVHDVIITIGFFSVLQMEFDLPVLAAVLAVIGYSLNDTIVVFDRIRENFRKIRRGTVEEIMNRAVNDTLSRTILTGLTTLLVLTALFLLGGDVIHGFAAALIVGILVGTYSSIFVASPIALMLGISREDMLPVKKEGAEQPSQLP